VNSSPADRDISFTWSAFLQTNPWRLAEYQNPTRTTPSSASARTASVELVRSCSPTVSGLPLCNSPVGSRNYFFGGLLSVHSRYGLWAHRVTNVTLYTERSDGSVTLAATTIATGWSEPVPGWELHPLKSSAFHGALLRQLSLLDEAKFRRLIDGVLRIEGKMPHLYPDGVYGSVRWAGSQSTLCDNARKRLVTTVIFLHGEFGCENGTVRERSR